ncbi:MAG: polyphosphate polymerase domain-containing protein [Paludibacteraceae bacterium]|nr:polyphosphate polymerase domain-containing protein [Paludibacteraceae bacterium]
MENSIELFSGFEPISLDEMNKVKLLDRMDRKFMFHATHLNDILAKAAEHYYILDIAGKRFAKYETTYFDTPDFDMYTRHHNGKLNRYKVRFRSYVDSNLNFFEIKFKSNKGRTIKSRIKLPDNKWSLEGDTGALLEKKTIYKASDLLPALQVNYNRITLVNKNMTERLTIDFGLNYVCGEKRASLPSLIIAEVKQDRSGSSEFISIMQHKRIKPASMSKYCLGIANTVNHVKLNNFKQKVRYVNQIFSQRA